MSFIDPDIEAYAESHSREESEVIKNLVARTKQELQYSQMLSGRVVGQLLAMLVQISGARKILEIGTFTGYSALRMAEALPGDGTLITCDYNERYEKIARSAFQHSEHGHKIKLIMGPATETIKTFEQTFDFIFLDADKNNYPNYYKLLLPKLKPGGLLVVDNVLWSGKVVNEEMDEKTQAIDQLNDMIHKDERVEHVLLTVRDGLLIARKRIRDIHQEK